MIDLILTVYLWGLIPFGMLVIHRIWFKMIFMNEVLWVILAWVFWPISLVMFIWECWND